MKIVVENIFMCLVLFWKCYFPTNFSHFLGYFLSIQTNFITENFKITAKSQHHTSPKLQFNPRQQTPAIKTNNHQNSTTTPPQQQQKSKSQREISGSKIGGSKARSRRGKIERRRDQRWDRAVRCDRRSAARSSGAVRSARCCKIERRGAARSSGAVRSGACDRQTGAQGSPATTKAWSGLPLLPLVRSLSLSLSLSLRVWPENGLKWKFELQTIFVVKGSFSSSTSNNFRKIYFPCAIKHPELRKSISESGLKSKQTQPKSTALSKRNLVKL